MRHSAAMGIAAVGLAIVAFLSGRLSAPAKTVERTKVEYRDRVVESTELQQRVRNLSLALEMASHQKNVVRTRYVTVAPDGTKTIATRTEDKSRTDTKTDTKADTATATVQESLTVRETVRTEERVKMVEREAPQWSAGVQAGVSVPGLLGRDVPSYLPGVPAVVVVGASIDRAILGPVYGGLWGNSRGDVGLAVRVTW